MQRAFFTFLVNRNLDKFVMQKIPNTQMRLDLKKNKNKNHILGFLANVVTMKKYCPWYRDDIEKKKDRYFSKARVRASFYDFCDDNNISKRYQPWPKIERRLVDAGLIINRVTDRSGDGASKQVMCYKLDKEVVRGIHRKMLENPKWDFDEMEDGEKIRIMDADCCVFGDKDLNSENVKRL